MLGMNTHVTMVMTSRGRVSFNKSLVSISVSELCF